MDGSASASAEAFLLFDARIRIPNQSHSPKKHPGIPARKHQTKKHPRPKGSRVLGDQSMTSVPKYSGRWKSAFSVPMGLHIP